MHQCYAEGYRTANTDPGRPRLVEHRYGYAIGIDNTPWREPAQTAANAFNL
jgi:hypothetical protein